MCAGWTLRSFFPIWMISEMGRGGGCCAGRRGGRQATIGETLARAAAAGPTPLSVRNGTPVVQTAPSFSKHVRPLTGMTMYYQSTTRTWSQLRSKATMACGMLQRSCSSLQPLTPPMRDAIMLELCRPNVSSTRQVIRCLPSIEHLITFGTYVTSVTDMFKNLWILLKITN